MGALLWALVGLLASLSTSLPPTTTLLSSTNAHHSDWTPSHSSKSSLLLSFSLFLSLPAEWGSDLWKAGADPRDGKWVDFVPTINTISI